MESIIQTICDWIGNHFGNFVDWWIGSLWFMWSIMLVSTFLSASTGKFKHWVVLYFTVNACLAWIAVYRNFHNDS